MVDKEYLEYIAKDQKYEQKYEQINRVWGKIDALFDLFMWIRTIDTDDLTRIDLLEMIQEEIILLANKYKNEVK